MTAGVAVHSGTPLKIEAPLSNREVFIANLAQHTTCIFSAPTSFKRSVKTTPARCTPRRSHRLAGAQVEFSTTELERRSTMKAMHALGKRALGIISEHEEVTDQAKEDYASIFGKPLNDVHLEALASLFNWDIPDFVDQDRGEVVMS
jgi:hypothetical protein